MPTYPSSGSEYGLGAVSADKRTGDFGTAYGIAADVAILVPKYSMSLGKEMTAYTGLVTLVQLCASTLGGLERQMLPSEMLDEIYQIQKDCGHRISNVVVMGTGEPLDNYDNLVRFLTLLTDSRGLGISQRNITVSTCGLVPRIYELADLQLQITLAISLHAVTDEKRREIMPVANRYSIEEILKACRYYIEKTGRRITFEYSLIRGVNDSREEAHALADLTKGLLCHINLIPVNPIEERDFRQSEAEAVLKFKNILENCGRNVTIRREMGRDIQAACGQLRKQYMQRASDSPLT